MVDNKVSAQGYNKMLHVVNKVNTSYYFIFLFKIGARQFFVR